MKTIHVVRFSSEQLARDGREEALNGKIFELRLLGKTLHMKPEFEWSFPAFYNWLTLADPDAKITHYEDNLQRHFRTICYKGIPYRCFELDLLSLWICLDHPTGRYFTRPEGFKFNGDSYEPTYLDAYEGYVDQLTTVLLNSRLIF